MIYNSRTIKLVPFTILPIALSSIQMYVRLPLQNTFLWWGIQFLVIFLFFWVYRYDEIAPEDRKAVRLVKYYLIWNLLSILNGFHMAENYWHFKSLIGMGMLLLIPSVVYVALNIYLVQDLLRFFVRYTIPCAILLFPFLSIGAWGWYLYPISLLMLFFPVLPIQGRILVLSLTLIVSFGDLGVRSHVIKYGVPVLITTGFYLTRRYLLFDRLIKIVRYVLIIAPIFLFSLGVSGIFNIFKMDEYIDGDLSEKRVTDDGKVVEEDLTVDTRTFIYIEVIESAIKHNYWLIGRSPARGNDAVWFADEMIELYGRPERPRNEVGILNVFTWTGIIGVIFFFLIFLRASYLGIYQSQNIYSKMIGFFVAFRWAYSWVEDYQVFDTNNVVLWIMIGLCFSSTFRNLNDFEVKLWASGIFTRRYKRAFQEYALENLN